MNKNTRAKHGCFSAAILLFLAGKAHAGFILEQPVPTPDKAPAPTVSSQTPDARAERARALASAPLRQKIDLNSMLTSRITQVGTTPDQIPYIRGMGRNVALMDALRQILPSGWRAYQEGDIDLTVTTDWAGSRSWIMALHNVLSGLNLRAQVDWTAKELTLLPPAEKPLAKPLKVDSPKTMAVADLFGKAKQPEYGYEKIQPEPTWELSPSKSLRENLRTWTDAAKWTLVWSAADGAKVVDYPVGAKVTFTGDLTGRTGAIARVIAAYADADRPLEVEFFRDNRVVEVRLHTPAATVTK